MDCLQNIQTTEKRFLVATEGWDAVPSFDFFCLLNNYQVSELGSVKTAHSIIRLTKRDELSFLTVLAFPKDSRMGLACRSCRSSSPCGQGGKAVRQRCPPGSPRSPLQSTSLQLGEACCTTIIPITISHISFVLTVVLNG